METADGNPVKWYLDEEDIACDDLETDRACGYECGSVEPKFRIGAGETLSFEWSGHPWSEIDVDAECSLSQCPVESCWLPDEASSGSFVLAATATTVCDGDCACPEDGEGSCAFVDGSLDLSPPELIAAEATVSLPTETVTLVF